MARPPRSSTRAASRAASRAATRHNPMADTRRNTVANRGRPRRSAGASASSSHGTRTSTVAVADTPRSVADMSLSDLLDAVGQRVQAEMGSRATAVQQGGQTSATVSVASEQAATGMQVAPTSAVPSGQTGEAIDGRFSCILSCQMLGSHYGRHGAKRAIGSRLYSYTECWAPGVWGDNCGAWTCLLMGPFLQHGHSGG